jgi:hypothetical protein
MEKISDYSIFQNHIIGAHALWEFCKYYEEYADDKQSPLLIVAMPVLPIVFNKRATDCIKNRNMKEGSLIKTIVENKDIYSGLQERMELSTDITFKSIHMAVSANLLIYDRESTQLIANRKSEPQIKNHKDYQDILASSRRVGAWFAKLSIQELTEYFNIKF